MSDKDRIWFDTKRNIIIPWLDYYDVSLTGKSTKELLASLREVEILVVSTNPENTLSDMTAANGFASNYGTLFIIHVMSGYHIVLYIDVFADLYIYSTNKNKWARYSPTTVI